MKHRKQRLRDQIIEQEIRNQIASNNWKRQIDEKFEKDLDLCVECEECELTMKRLDKNEL